MLVILFIFLITSPAKGGTFEKKVDSQVKSQIGQIRVKSVATVTMEDYLWRDARINKGKYGDRLASKLVSLYFSTHPGGKIYAHPTSGDPKRIARDELKNDLKNYFQLKMKKNFRQTAYPVDYSLIIVYEGGEDRQEIRVEPENYDYPDASWMKTGFKIPVTEGGKAEGVLFTRTTRGYYGLEAASGSRGGGR